VPSVTFAGLVSVRVASKNHAQAIRVDFLIDTNILIPIEPASGADLEALSGPISDLVRQI
jgi:hypothetical protein